MTSSGTCSSNHHLENKQCPFVSSNDCLYHNLKYDSEVYDSLEAAFNERLAQERPIYITTTILSSCSVYKLVQLLIDPQSTNGSIQVSPGDFFLLYQSFISPEQLLCLLDYFVGQLSRASTQSDLDNDSTHRLLQVIEAWIHSDWSLFILPQHKITDGLDFDLFTLGDLPLILQEHYLSNKVDTVESEEEKLQTEKDFPTKFFDC